MVLRKSLSLAVLLAFRVTALLTCVNDHSLGRRINNERGNNQIGNRIIKLTHWNPDYHGLIFSLLLLLCPLFFPLPSHHPLSPPLLIFEWQSRWYSRPSKPLSLPPLVSLVNGCQSELGPHADWQQVSSCSGNNYDRAAVEMDSRVDSPHCAALLRADGVLPWEAIIAGCQLTARFFCQRDQPSSSGFLWANSILNTQIKPLSNHWLLSEE